MFATLWIGLALVWTVVVVDVIGETAEGERGLRAFGGILTEPGRSVTLWVVALLAASAAVALTLAIGGAIIARRERKAAADLDARFEQLAADEAASSARREQLEGRVAELHRRIETLSRERQTVEDVLSRERRRATELRSLSVRSAKAIDEASRSLTEPEVVELPESDPAERRG